LGPQPFRRDDPNADGLTDISDGVAILGYLFLGFFALSILITVLLYYWWKNFQDMILNL
jgi:hypothetical protein